MKRTHGGGQSHMEEVNHTRRQPTHTEAANHAWREPITDGGSQSHMEGANHTWREPVTCAALLGTNRAQKQTHNNTNYRYE